MSDIITKKDKSSKSEKKNIDRLKQYIEAQGRLNKISFKGLENIKAGAVLAFPLSWLVFEIYPPALKGIIGQLFLDRNDWDIQRNGGVNLVFVTHLYLTRKDHLDAMDKIASTMESFDKAIPISKRKFTLRNLRLLPLLVSWYRQLSANGFTHSWKKTILLYLLCAKNYLDAACKKVSFSDYQNVLVRMDSQVCDSAIAQYAHSLGCVTMTVQDGFDTKTCAQALVPMHCQAKLRGSTADYCLSWSRYFADVIKETVPNEQKVVPLGIPKYIKMSEKTAVNENVFGVLLDYGDNRDSNREMIEIANQIAKKYKMTYVLRYHPRQTEDIYKTIADPELCKASERGTDFYAFVCSCNFLIGCNSTTMLESLFINNRTYRMNPVRGDDTLAECGYPLCFSTVEELDVLINNKTSVSEEYLEYLCGPKNVCASYAEFFRSLIGRNENVKKSKTY